jgi:hypothetical protein
MAERVPILIGVTGKRDLKDQDEAVRERLRAAFDRLDQEAPNAPKLLLSGMAVGADTIAAALALARPDWLVAAVLPFDTEIYFEDFGGEELAVLETLLADPRVKTVALPPLVNPYTGEPCTREELRNSANATNPLRVMHYEQLGLWLAHAATLLIAVLPKDEEPDQAGGTARVVQYRLSGRPDTVAARVMEASEVVAPPLPLDIATRGPVWLIDAPSNETSHHPFTVQLAESDRRASAGPRHAARRTHSSLAMARGFDGLAWRSGDTVLPFAWLRGALDPIAVLGAIHTEIDRIQGRHKLRLVSSSYVLAALFWLAVGAFGVVELARYATGNLSLWALACYLVLAAGAVIVHWTIDRHHWQRITEDYRGVIEALRVQRAWWHAGLAGPADQVDRYFLSAAPLPLLYVRQAVRNIVHWARLSGAPQPPKSDWREVYDRENPDCWIRGQIDYFRRRADQRRRAVARTKMLSWEAFFAAQFLAAWLFLDIVAEKLPLQRLDDILWWSSNWARPSVFLAAATLIWVGRHIRTRTAPAPRRWSAAFAVALALLIGPGLYLIGVALRPEIPNADQLAIALAVVLLIAGAVAVRFVAEKLVWEAEAHRYEAALALFERAAGELDRIGPPTEASRTVVRALGRAALEENEYWLRAHRERPVEQAVG